MYHIKMYLAINVKQCHAKICMYIVSACMCIDINREEARQSASQAWSSVFRTSTKVAVIFHRQPIAVSDISVYICLIDIRSKSKEQLNERRAGLSMPLPLRILPMVVKFPYPLVSVLASWEEPG